MPLECGSALVLHLGGCACVCSMLLCLCMCYSWRKRRKVRRTYRFSLTSRPMALGPESSMLLSVPPLGRAIADPELSCLELGFHCPLGWPALCSQCRPSCWLPSDILGARPRLRSTAGHRQLVTQEQQAFLLRGRATASTWLCYLQDPDHITGNSCKASE